MKDEKMDNEGKLKISRDALESLRLDPDAKLMHTHHRDISEALAIIDAPSTEQFSITDPVVEANRAMLLSRSQVGIKKYGVTLASSGLTERELLVHALEESLDLANYLQANIQRVDAAPLASTEQPAGASADGILSHPEIHSYTWTKREREAIADWGAQQREAGRRDAHETNVSLLNDSLKYQARAEAAEKERDELRAALAQSTAIGEAIVEITRERDAARAQLARPADLEGLKQYSISCYEELEPDEDGEAYLVADVQDRLAGKP